MDARAFVACMLSVVGTAGSVGTAAAAEWRPTQEIEGGSGPVDVAMDPEGNALAVWSSDLAASGLRWSYRPRDGHFGSAATLADYAAVDAQVDVDAEGRFTAVWVDGGGSVKSAAWAVAGDFARPVTLAPAPGRGETRGFPELDVSPSGAAVAVWQTTSKDSAGRMVTRVEGALRPRGGGAWSTAEEVAPGNVSDTSYRRDWVEAGIDSTGKALVLFRRWIKADGPAYDPFLALGWGDRPQHEVVLGQAGNGFGDPLRVSEDGESLWKPSLAVSPQGDTLIAYFGAEHTDAGVQQRLLVKEGSTSDPRAPAREIARYSDQQTGIALARFDDTGRAHVFYGRRDGVALTERGAGATLWAVSADVTGQRADLLQAMAGPAGDLIVAGIDANHKLRAWFRNGGASAFTASPVLDEKNMNRAVAAGGGVGVVVGAGPHRATVFDEPAITEPSPPAPVPADTQPPRCDLDRRVEYSGDALGFVAECNEAVRLHVRARLLIRSAATSQVKLAARRLRLRESTATEVMLKLSRRGARVLAKRRRARLAVRVTATDRAGNSGVVTRKLSILAGE